MVTDFQIPNRRRMNTTKQQSTETMQPRMWPRPNRAGSRRSRLCFALCVSLLSGCGTFKGMVGKSTTDEGRMSLLRTVDERTQAEACRGTAIELARSERDEHAIAQFERARTFDATLEGIAHPLAVLYDRQGKFDAADREYRLALKEQPKDPDVVNDYGFFLYSRGDLVAAEKQLRRAVDLKQDHPKARINLGMTLAAQQKFNEAFTVFEAALGPAAAHHNVGMLLARADRKSEAISHLEQAAHGDPSLLQTQQILASMREAAPESAKITLTNYEEP